MSLDNKTITLRCADCNTPLENQAGTSIPYCPNCKPQKNHVMNLDGSHAVSVCWCHPTYQGMETPMRKPGPMAEDAAVRPKHQELALAVYALTENAGKWEDAAQLLANYERDLLAQKPAAPDTERRLRELVQKWREKVDLESMPTDRAIGFGDCADELEAALAPSTGTEAAKDD